MILNFLKPFDTSLLINFLVACLGVILGLSIFLSGVDLSISKIGLMMGDFVGELNKLHQIVFFGVFIGFIISMTTPFIIAICLGISKLMASHNEEDSFALVGIALTGPVNFGLMMTLYANFSKIAIEDGNYIDLILSVIISSTFAMLPIVLIFFIMNHFVFKKKNLKSLILVLMYTLIGLIIFIASVEGGFMDLARQMGENYSDFKLLHLVGFILGILVVLVKPMVYALSDQVEEVTGGSIHQKTILIILSIGVALSVSLSMLKLNIGGFKLWMVVILALIISLLLSRKISQNVAIIAFDLGGVTSEPIIATFILAFCQGVSGSNSYGFEVIAFVAMMSIVTIMTLVYIIGVDNEAFNNNISKK
ncbi:MAG: DUF1538 family protein [Peptoniphilaceae bacterium]|nr:DUF1538 domain-containing protein [Peptoniphilaceae bacterium]MDY3738546.1 DUF1538 family protein [Peptoniphilaceae bacterium]